MPGTRIVIAGEIYSPNLGDGIIFETLKYLFQRLDPHTTVIPLDISGRAGWSQPGLFTQYRLKGIAHAKRFSGILYSFVNLARLQGLYWRRLRMQWVKLLEDVDALVIGGGKLLMDNHLDFPFKLDRLCSLARQADLPVHISACGVGEKWSPAGKRMILRVLCQASSITLRDSLSKTRLEKLAPKVSSMVTFDPAIWAADVYGQAPEAKTGMIGLGLINIADLNAYRSKQDRINENEIIQFWVGVMQRLLKENREIEIFTNGNLSDKAFAIKLACTVLDTQGISFSLANRPTRPVELARQVSHYRGIIAFRLHTHLLAAAYRIPTVGLEWDAKVRSFFSDIGHPDFCYSLEGIGGGMIAEKLLNSIESGLNQDSIEICKEKALLSPRLIL
jgi:polysaccharide pyruvyl transferase WcaK-like protein